MVARYADSAAPRAPRFPVELPIRFRRIDESKWHHGRTENVSRSGVLFRCDLAVKAGTWIEMGFTIPAEALGQPGAEVDCRGFVSRAEPPAGRRLQARVAATISDYRFVRQGKVSKGSLASALTGPAPV